jgi:hypothetical protein
MKRRNEPFTKRIRAIEKKSTRKREKRASELTDARHELAEVHANYAACARSNRAFHDDNIVIRAALRDAVKLIDVMTLRAGKRPLPLLDVSEIRRLEEIRLLSIGV